MDHPTSRPISRRQVLKRLGSAGTAIWATPIVASIRPRGPTASLCPDCSPACGDNNAACQGPPPNDPCICAQRHEGGCVCIQWDAHEPCRPCGSDADCESHQYCVDFEPPCPPCIEGQQPTTANCWGRCPFS